MEAAYFEQLDGTTVQCRLCPNECVIADGKAGACRIRRNDGGTLMANAYGEVVSLSVDPIEKKPLYHFHPGKPILSTGPNGCNFRCGFCQNSGISQGRVPTRHMEPGMLADLAENEGSIGVAYTYTEPFIWFEYIRDTGKIVRERGMVNVMVSNGYVNEAPLRELLPVIDAMNVDIKSMRPEFYSTVCGGKLEDVLRTVEIAAGACHVEVTNLVITGHNDTDDDFRKLAEWIAGVDETIPLHFSRYFPRHTFTAPPTSADTLRRAHGIAADVLPYVYIGNISIDGTVDTRCPACGHVLVNRSCYTAGIEGVQNGKCSNCGRTVDIAGVD